MSTDQATVSPEPATAGALHTRVRPEPTPLRSEPPATGQPLPGMGAIVTDDGVAFRVWAPHASGVSVMGEFNGWDTAASRLTSEDNGYWYGYVEGAEVGQDDVARRGLARRAGRARDGSARRCAGGAVGGLGRRLDDLAGGGERVGLVRRGGRRRPRLGRGRA